MNLIESCPIDSDTLPYINSVAFYPEVLNSISEFPDFNYYLELNKISFEELAETLKSLFACNAFDELNDFVLYCYQNNYKHNVEKHGFGIIFTSPSLKILCFLWLVLGAS